MLISINQSTDSDTRYWPLGLNRSDSMWDLMLLPLLRAKLKNNLERELERGYCYLLLQSAWRCYRHFSGQRLNDSSSSSLHVAVIRTGFSGVKRGGSPFLNWKLSWLRYCYQYKDPVSTAWFPPPTFFSIFWIPNFLGVVLEVILPSSCGNRLVSHLAWHCLVDL